MSVLHEATGVEGACEALDAARRTEALQRRVTVRTGPGGRVETTSTEFWLDYFDFPMIDNTRLPHGQRCAVVVKDFGDPIVEITLVYFPGSRASLKEKPFYDEALHDLLYTRSQIDKEKKK